MQHDNTASESLSCTTLLAQFTHKGRQITTFDQSSVCTPHSFGSPPQRRLDIPPFQSFTDTSGSSTLRDLSKSRHPSYTHSDLEQQREPTGTAEPKATCILMRIQSAWDREQEWSAWLRQVSPVFSFVAEADQDESARQRPA